MRPLDVTSNEDAKAKGWHVEFGPGAKHPTAHRLNKPELCEGALEGWELVQEAWYDGGEESVLYTTKRLHVPGGWIYQTQTSVLVKTGGVPDTTFGLTTAVPAVGESQSTVFVPLPVQSAIGGHERAMTVMMLNEAVESARKFTGTTPHTVNAAIDLVEKVAKMLEQDR